MNTLDRAIEAVKKNEINFTKFISLNDAGDTGAHQSGIYIPKSAVSLLFEEPGIKGQNKEKLASISWDDGTVSQCRFIYYGQGTRNEYRITRLGKTLQAGNFLILSKVSDAEYSGFVLADNEQIEKFLTEFNLKQEDTNNLLPLPPTFKPRARIIKIIGQELISNDVIALVELIKNSYDADAENIDIELDDIFVENGQIYVRDNGNGMSYEKVVNVWLEPATPDKKSTNSQATFSNCFKRRLLGEKGIGRFAAHRLGDKIELITRARIDCDNTLLPYETKVELDWSDFTEDRYLNEIPIKVFKIEKPQVFKEFSGTLIKITNIHPWKNLKAVKDAVLRIKSLESPVKPKTIKLHENAISSDPGLNVKVSSKNADLQHELADIRSLSELLKSAFYSFSGIIDSSGKILYDYTFNRIDFQGNKRSEKSRVENLKDYDVDWFEQHPLDISNSPGSFEVSFYAWDLETASLKIAGLADYYRSIIKPNAGVRIYRDNFRVWPYGEVDDDWLGLDLKRLNSPKERPVSRNQVFGVIHISSIENSKLQDQSNREGLIVSPQYEQFYHLVSSAMTLFARERK